MHWKELFKETNDHMMTENAIYSHLMANGIHFKDAGNIPFEKINGFYYCKPVNKPIEDIQKYLNDKLRIKLAGYSCNEVAAKSGLNQSNVSTWHKGKDLGVYSLEKIAKGFGFSIYIDMRMS